MDEGREGEEYRMLLGPSYSINWSHLEISGVMTSTSQHT